MTEPGTGARRARRPCVFLDRDGTINREVDFLTDPDELELVPGAGAALARLQAAGFALVVVTNQSGIARGYLDEARLREIHRHLDALLAAEHAAVERYYHCPHHPTAGQPPYRRRCRCRKPGPELLERAADELGLDLARSYLVGDSLRDLDAAAAVGVAALLVRTGKGRDEERKARAQARTVSVVDDLAAAAERILDERRG